MNINWFPGHMTKSLRMMEASAKVVDAFIYLLDGRAVYSCINPELDRVVGGKPVLYVVSKADLISDADLMAILTRLRGEGKSVVSFSFNNSKAREAVVLGFKKLCVAKFNKYANKGANAVIRGMVVGIPNSGKSTFINCLAKTGATITGNKAGVTRGKQWIKVDNYFELLDTPGTLYPKLSSELVASRLAIIGSINDDILDHVDLSIELIRQLDLLDEGYIFDRYKLNKEDFLGVLPEFKLEGIAKSRGFLKKGSELDIEKASRAVIDDFRKGRLGKIALER